MNPNLSFCEDDDLQYEVTSARRTATVGERVKLASSRNLTGHERATQQARYQRRPAPTRMSGTHRRGNKRRGI